MDQKWIDRLVNKMDTQDNRIDKIDICLTEIKADLREHMRRTAANEETNSLLKEHIEIVQKESDERLRKLEKVKDNFHFLGWCLAALFGLVQGLKHLGLF